jgi:hypothetical protein
MVENKKKSEKMRRWKEKKKIKRKKAAQIRKEVSDG